MPANVQIWFDPDLGCVAPTCGAGYTPTYKNQMSAWFAANPRYSFARVFNDTSYPQASYASSGTPSGLPVCTPNTQIFTPSGSSTLSTTINPDYCPLHDYVFIGAAGNSAAGAAGASGYPGGAGASGGLTYVQGLTTDSGNYSVGVQVGAAGQGTGSGNNTQIKSGWPVLASGSLYGASGTNASGTSGGNAGTQNCSPTLTAGVWGSIVCYAGANGKNGASTAGVGGPGGASAPTLAGPAYQGAAPTTGTGGGGGAGTSAAGSQDVTQTGGVGGSYLDGTTGGSGGAGGATPTAGTAPGGGGGGTATVLRQRATGRYISHGLAVRHGPHALHGARVLWAGRRRRRRRREQGLLGDRQRWGWRQCGWLWIVRRRRRRNFPLRRDRRRARSFHQRPDHRLRLPGSLIPRPELQLLRHDLHALQSDEVEQLQGGPAMPYGVDPALRAWTQSQTGQWPYYLGGIGALGQNWGGNAAARRRTRLGCTERKETDDPRIPQPIFPGRVRPQAGRFGTVRRPSFAAARLIAAGRACSTAPASGARRLAWGLTARATACNSTRNTRRRAGRSRLNARCRPPRFVVPFSTSYVMAGGFDFEHLTEASRIRLGRLGHPNERALPEYNMNRILALHAALVPGRRLDVGSLV